MSSLNAGLFKSEIDQETITALVRHLFDPASPPSSSRTRGLVSPNLVIDWPFLPSSESSPIAGVIGRLPEEYDDRYDIPDVPRRRRRHTPSAQTLALFRFPAVLVNHLPGGRSRWDLDISDVENISHEAKDESWPLLHIIQGSSRWRAVLNWTLELKSLPTMLVDNMPGGQMLDNLSSLEYSSNTRNVELIFSPTQVEIDRAAREEGLRSLVAGPSSSNSWRRPAPSPADLRLQLVRVRYNGLGFSPEAQYKIPIYRHLRIFFPWLLSFLVAPAYGVLLFLGLDHSNRSLDSSSRRKRRSDRRKRFQEARTQASHQQDQNEIQDIKGKGRRQDEQGSYGADDSDAMSSASALTASDVSSSDPYIIESEYHRSMRHYNVYLSKAQAVFQAFLALAYEMSEEVGVVGWAVRQLVYLAVEVGFIAAGVGKDVILAAEEERTRIDGGAGVAARASNALGPNRKRRMREHARDRIEAQAQVQAQEDEHGASYPPRPRGQKRVSFSLAQPPLVISGPASGLEVESPSSSTNSGTDEPDRTTSATDQGSIPITPDRDTQLTTTDTDNGADDTTAGTHRYYQNYGRPAVTVQSPLAQVRAQVAELAAEEARGRRESLDDLYVWRDPARHEEGHGVVTALGVDFGPEAATSGPERKKEDDFKVTMEQPRVEQEEQNRAPPLIPSGRQTEPIPVASVDSTTHTPELSPEVSTHARFEATGHTSSQPGIHHQSEEQERRASVASSGLGSPQTPSDSLVERRLGGLGWVDIGEHQHGHGHDYDSGRKEKKQEMSTVAAGTDLLPNVGPVSPVMEHESSGSWSSQGRETEDRGPGEGEKVKMQVEIGSGHQGVEAGLHEVRATAAVPVSSPRKHEREISGESLGSAPGEVPSGTADNKTGSQKKGSKKKKKAKTKVGTAFGGSGTFQASSLGAKTGFE